ncbi:PAS domain-containing sensor histidine kinase [Fibrivirga algicola]|nr:ATP-binding protein [Fibrivirga algicola]
MNNLSSTDTLQLSPGKAMLVLEFKQAPAAHFRVRQANVTGSELVEGIPHSLTGAVLDQLPLPFSSAELAGQLHQVLAHGEPASFRLAYPISDDTYTCQAMRIDEAVLVLSLERLEQEKAVLLDDVLEKMATGLIILQPICDGSGAIIDFQATLCNELAAHILGQSRELILSKPVSERYEKVHDNVFFHQYIAVAVSGVGLHQLMHLPTRDSWLDVSVSTYGDGLLVSFQDVTAGQQTASMLASVMRSSPAAVRYYETIRDSTGQIVDFMTSTGNELSIYESYRPHPSAVGRTLLDIYPHLKGDGTFDRYVTVVETGESAHFEMFYQLETQFTWFDCTAVPHGKGFVITVLDITPTKQAQLAQERQAALLTGVLNSSASSIVVLEPMYNDAAEIHDFRISLANPATQTLFTPFVGHTFDHELIQNQTLLTLFPASRNRDVFTALKAVITTKKPIYHSVDYSTLAVAYDYALTPFQTGVLMITTDITPLRAYQQKLEANNAALSRSNEYLQQFAYVASHDLQEPLRKIYSFGDLLLKHHANSLDTTGQDLLQRMQNAALRMQTLVKDLLDYSRLTTQQSPFQSVSMQGVIQDVLADLETTIRDKQATVAVDCHSLPTVPGDKTQLRQLVQNLVANAIKFTAPNQLPQVRITAELLTADRLPQPVQNKLMRRWISLRIADQGIGFDEVYQERIFELFHRLHGRSQYMGTGIGLAVVKKVVENHHGQITVQSQPGAGAAFTVYLPMDY